MLAVSEKGVPAFIADVIHCRAIPSRVHVVAGRRIKHGLSDGVGGGRGEVPRVEADVD